MLLLLLQIIHAVLMKWCTEVVLIALSIHFISTIHFFVSLTLFLFDLFANRTQVFFLNIIVLLQFQVKLHFSIILNIYRIES
jgi:hypothetical protein